MLYSLIRLKFLTFSFLFALTSQAEVPADCGALYAQRAQAVSFAVQAGACYQDQLQRSAASVSAVEKETLLTQKSLAAAWVNLHTQSAQEKRSAIEDGLAASQALLDAGIVSGSYWRAVFITFDCQERDGHTVLPKCMFRNLGAIQSLLLDAMKNAPQTHAYGPDRVYGMMYMQMPRIVGGSYPIALEHLKKAYELAPELSLNSLYYAKILIKTGDTALAKKVLSELISKTANQIDPLVMPEALEDQAEAKKLLSEL